MDRKWYLFEKKISNKRKVIGAIIYIILIAIGIAISENLYDGILVCVLLLLLLLVPALLFLSCKTEKLFWVEFRETYVIRQGEHWGAAWRKKKIFYEEAGYIVTGHAEPFIVPNGGKLVTESMMSKMYHKKCGDYINVTDKNRDVLFTVRYSEEVLELLKEKCINAQMIDIEDYKKIRF